MMETLDDQLQPFRNAIDRIDQQILELLNKRGELSLKIGTLKHRYDHTLNNIRNRERELEILNNITTHNRGPFSDMQLTTIFELIFEEHRSLQRGIKDD